MTRLVTLALADGSTVAVRRDGEALHAFRDLVGERYGDVGALLRGGLETASIEEGVVEGSVVRPVLEPGAVACVGINYGAHIAEMRRETPTSPTYFSKLPRALTDPGVPVILPRESPKVDYEGEVAAVIGRRGRRITRESALDHVAGLTLVNDVSMRDFQNRSLQWFAGKSWQACTPVGPEVVTLDELGDLGDLGLTTTVNGEVRQRAVLGDLIFDIPALVADLSQIVELEPGDLIVTGTPGGVGHAMEPPRYLQPGDVVEVSLDGLGTLRTVFAAEA
jgi:acylpyruvate hydrolase